jgi:hypothetical protein
MAGEDNRSREERDRTPETIVGLGSTALGGDRDPFNLTVGALATLALNDETSRNNRSHR